MLSVWLGETNICRVPIHQKPLFWRNFAYYQAFMIIPMGIILRHLHYIYNHYRPTWQTKKSDLSKHLDSNQSTLLSSFSHALSHSFAVKERIQKKILNIQVYVSGVTACSSFRKHCLSCL